MEETARESGIDKKMTLFSKSLQCLACCNNVEHLARNRKQLKKITKITYKNHKDDQTPKQQN